MVHAWKTPFCQSRTGLEIRASTAPQQTDRPKKTQPRTEKQAPSAPSGGGDACFPLSIFLTTAMSTPPKRSKKTRQQRKIYYHPRGYDLQAPKFRKMYSKLYHPPGDGLCPQGYIHRQHPRVDWRRDFAVPSLPLTRFVSRRSRTPRQGRRSVGRYSKSAI